MLSKLIFMQYSGTIYSDKLFNVLIEGMEEGNDEVMDYTEPESKGDITETSSAQKKYRRKTIEQDFPSVCTLY